MVAVYGSSAIRVLDGSSSSFPLKQRGRWRPPLPCCCGILCALAMYSDALVNCSLFRPDTGRARRYRRMPVVKPVYEPIQRIEVFTGVQFGGGSPLRRSSGLWRIPASSECRSAISPTSTALRRACSFTGDVAWPRVAGKRSVWMTRSLERLKRAEPKERVRELERILGCKTAENEILREALDTALAKNRSRCRSGRTKRWPMTAIAGTLGVSRSGLYGRLGGQSKPRGPYRKAGDVNLSSDVPATAITGSRQC